MAKGAAQKTPLDEFEKNLDWAYEAAKTRVQSARDLAESEKREAQQRLDDSKELDGAESEVEEAKEALAEAERKLAEAETTLAEAGETPADLDAKKTEAAKTVEEAETRLKLAREKGDEEAKEAAKNELEEAKRLAARAENDVCMKRIETRLGKLRGEYNHNTKQDPREAKSTLNGVIADLELEEQRAKNFDLDQARKDRISAALYAARKARKDLQAE